MQKNSIEPIKTFTVSFENKKYDESVYSKKVSKYLNTDHHELIVQPKDIINLIPKLSELSDIDKQEIHFIHFNHTNPLLQEGSPAQSEVLKKGFNLAKEGQSIRF